MITGWSICATARLGFVSFSIERYRFQSTTEIGPESSQRTYRKTASPARSTVIGQQFLGERRILRPPAKQEQEVEGTDRKWYTGIQLDGHRNGGIVTCRHRRSWHRCGGAGRLGGDRLASVHDDDHHLRRIDGEP